MTSKYAFSDGTMPPIIFDLEALIDFRFYALTLANKVKVTVLYGTAKPLHNALYKES